MFRWISEKLLGKVEHEPDVDVPIRLSTIEGAWCQSLPLPYPDWSKIAQVIDSLPPETPRKAAWSEAERQWLDEVCDVLGEPYVWVESGPVLLLTAREADAARALANMAQGALQVVHEVLGPPPSELRGKLSILALTPADTYYTYISSFYADGDYGTSGGVCLSPNGHVHVAVIDVGIDLERTLVHEIVHVRLHGIDLPLWVEEGAAEVVSRKVARAQPLTLDARELRRLQHWWQKRGLNDFWAGKTFSRSDRGQQLSYTLAEVLVSNMIADGGRRFAKFLADARAGDAGDSAAREHLGLSISELASRFLGEGDWGFDPREADGSASPTDDESDQSQE
jgi:hypothetical protein